MMDTTPPSRGREPITSDPRVSTFLASVRDEYLAPLPHDVASAHLRTILAAAAEAPAPARLSGRWAVRLRRIAAVGAVKVALTATAAAALTGTGLAATGQLPDAAQSAVAGIAQRVGITLPVPPVDTPGDREDADGNARPGIGRGGVPALIEDGDAEHVPGRAGDAPGHDRGDDGRPTTPATAGDDARPSTPASEHAEVADERPEAGSTAGRSADTPATERPAEAPPTAPQQQRPESAAGADSAPAPAGESAEDGGASDDAPAPAERPTPTERAGQRTGETSD